jgi:hypothetical protein
MKKQTIWKIAYFQSLTLKVEWKHLLSTGGLCSVFIHGHLSLSPDWEYKNPFVIWELSSRYAIMKSQMAVHEVNVGFVSFQTFSGVHFFELYSKCRSKHVKKGFRNIIQFSEWAKVLKNISFLVPPPLSYPVSHHFTPGTCKKVFQQNFLLLRILFFCHCQIKLP